MLIWQTLENHYENPVATTISTYPIEQAIFPQIYICPPMHTYTNLNYDIIDTYKRNVTLNTKQLVNLQHLIDEIFEEVGLDNSLEKIDFVEENKYRNWYFGLSSVLLGQFYQEDEIRKHELEHYEIKSTSGKIRTPLYEEPVNKNDFYHSVSYSYDLMILHNCSLDQKLVVELNFDTKETRGGRESVTIESSRNDWTTYKNTGPQRKIFSFTEPSYSALVITFKRDLGTKNILEWKTLRNTGLEIKWYFVDKNNKTITINPDKEPKISSIDGLDEQYTKIVNLYLAGKKHTKFNSVVQQLRTKISRRNDQNPIECQNTQIFDQNEIQDIITSLEIKLNLDRVNTTAKYNVTDADLKKAAHIMFYLINCPDSELSTLRLYLKEIISSNNVPMIIMSLNKLNTYFGHKNMIQQVKIVTTILDKLTNLLNLEHKKLGDNLIYFY